MDLQLSKQHIFKAGVTSAHTLVVLPSSSSKDKVAVGDQNGVLTCFGMKKGQSTVVFTSESGSAIKRLERTADRIFLARAAQVQGYSKKGKVFFEMTTFMTEDINSMFVVEEQLHLAGTHVYNHYDNCKERDYFVVGDKISDLIGVRLPDTIRGVAAPPNFTPALGCYDNCVRLLEGSNLLLGLEVNDSVTALHSFYQGPGQAMGQLLYGSLNGSFGLLDICSSTYEFPWVIQEQKLLGGVNAIKTHDINGDGILEIIVGRDDGKVEVYGFDQSEVAPVRISAEHLPAAVMSLDVGKVNSDSDEIIAGLYSGSIFSLTADATARQGAEIHKTQIESLRAELSELSVKVDESRERYLNVFDKDLPDIATLQEVPVNDKFVLNAEDSSYHLTVELQSSIDLVILQSDVPLDLLDVKESTAIVSFSPTDPSKGIHLLATYRCQPGVTKLHLKTRSIEGQFGTLQVMIIPQVQPKVCQIKTYSIKPLSLHKRSLDPFDHARPHSALRIEGQFSFAMLHNWIVNAIPDVPLKGFEEQKALLTFRSTFLTTMLECEYSDGVGVFKSDNLSTISILEDVLSREALKRNVTFNITHEIEDGSVAHTLALMHPKLEYQLMLSKKVEIIDALKELSQQEGNQDFLTIEYTQILDNAESLQAEFKMQPCQLERLYGIVTDLFIDKFKFKGVDVKGHVGELVTLLDHYNFDELIAFFETSFE
eukprot:m.558250 g.558250  ORF g.558250 m.558250 type:complete len:710 (-) comp57764_c0_seq28:1822-3951(-)